MYRLLDTEHMVCCDVDDTLLMWDWYKYDFDSLITIEDPYTKQNKTYGVHKAHVLLLKQYKARGYKITVWSKGGQLHAESAVKALGLEEVVDYVMAKPEKVMDDKSELSSIVGPVVFIDPTLPTETYEETMTLYKSKRPV